MAVVEKSVFPCFQDQIDVCNSYAPCYNLIDRLENGVPERNSTSESKSKSKGIHVFQDDRSNYNMEHSYCKRQSGLESKYYCQCLWCSMKLLNIVQSNGRTLVDRQVSHPNMFGLDWVLEKSDHLLSQKKCHSSLDWWNLFLSRCCIPLFLWNLS